jgi:hypothetical protein
MTRKIALTLLSLGLAACTDTRRAEITAPVPPAGASLAYVTISDTHPAKGSLVVVTVNSGTGANAEPLGSFAARLSLGSGLEFVAEVPLSDGMRALRAEKDEVIAAGAAPGGFTDGRLFAVQARVLDPSALSEISVSFSEASGTGFADQVKSLKIDRALYLGVPK